MAEICKDLPDECWELIFNRLNTPHLHSHLESPSLACKQFLSIINRLRTHLTIVDPTVTIHGTLSKLFNRFPHVKSIDLSNFRGCLHRVIVEIAFSDLNLETLDISNTDRLPLEGLKLLGSRKKCLRVFKCSHLHSLKDLELRSLAECFPWLEEVDISDPTSASQDGLTDFGIEELSFRLKALRKINISNNPLLSDRSLITLSRCCALLEEVVIRECDLVTHRGINFVMHSSPNLRSLTVDRIWVRTSPMVYSLTSARRLTEIYLYNSVVPDEFLYSLSKAEFPLKRFGLGGCWAFTFSGISSVLNSYQSLEVLDLMVVFLTDDNMNDLCNYLSGVITINLSSCSKLTESTLFTLAKNCPLLTDIGMEGTNLGGGVGAARVVKNPRIKSLRLANNLKLTDECLGTLASVCPSLEMLDVSSCKCVTEKGIANFLKSGSKIRDLRINGCEKIKNIGTDFELPTLEVLQAARSGINDQGLVTIGNRCCGILTLDVEGCSGVTVVGLQGILANCKRLRVINLDQCVNMSARAVNWIVFSRRSLRKVVVPHSSLPSEGQNNLFLRHGCLVCQK